MSFGAYGILIIFGLFVLLLVLNPNISCFGKRIKSPFRPLLRPKRKKIEITDYKFDLVDPEDKKRRPPEKTVEPTDRKKKKTEDYGFRLD